MKIPYDVINNNLFEKLSKIYYLSQKDAWDSQTVLADSLEKNNGINLSPELTESIKNIFYVILWGEYIAWEISADLALKIKDVGPKMAATAQVFDEARHFRILLDYLNKLGGERGNLHPAAERLLSKVMNANTLEKKLLGMQMMVEPVAIAIFQTVRKSNVEPVLSDLLNYIEIDESRHIALGINYLPTLIKKMGFFKKYSLLFWQLKLLFLQVDELKALEPDLIKLGIDPIDLFHRVEKKQLSGMKELFLEIGMNEYLLELLRKAVYFKKDKLFQ